MAWLPPIDPLANHGGDWAAYQANLQNTLEQEFVQSTPRLDGKPCLLSKPPADQLWHLISEGPGVEEDRVADMRRCETVCWVRPMIEAVARGDARMWREVKKNAKGVTKRRVHVALNDFSHLVVFTETKKVMLLVTAFPVAQQHYRAKLKKSWEADAGHKP